MARASLWILLIHSLIPVLPAAAGLPTGVAATSFYATDSIRFSAPVWIGPFPGIAGALLIGEATGGLQVLEPEGNGYRKRTFGAVPASFFSGNDGLLGLAFHPDFLRNGRYFACYNPARGKLVLEERAASSDRRSDAGAVRTLLRLDLAGVVHQGGDLHFGPDGRLYLGIGDGGNPLVYNARSQDLGQLFGKMLRLDVDHADAGLEYAVPKDNPFLGVAGARPEIWALGFRQPWRFSFDVDGSLLAGDVGDWVHEEVDIVVRGGNYGWSRMEGTTCFNKADETLPLEGCETAGLLPPAAVVPHTPFSTAPTACIIGGYVFRGDPASPFYGAYLFGDYLTRKLYGVRLGAGAPPSEVGIAPTAISTFGMDLQGNLYVAGYNNGIIYRLTHPGLTGKGVAVRPRLPRLRAPRAAGRLRASDFPGAPAVCLADLEGRVLRRYPAARLSPGLVPDLPRGLYLAWAEGKEGAAPSPFLLP